LIHLLIRLAGWKRHQQNKRKNEANREAAMKNPVVDSPLFLLSHSGCYASIITAGKRSCQANCNYGIVRRLASTQRTKKTGFDG